ncbi:L,D-transpeptidase family protein [Arthrobacter sp. MSA 4-2]|uniref:L,D-transpeptidase n=1 Tax=Arthrobacter sp. MSA 4-2 TaxID=2794349 RepID=UPI0018E7B423|nr:Ig-like domain-containing protein [Arthrobacter sp. MSA 4-2]MBJ2119654.1 L,D-transpeptidase family protein [Arthrobacter sp. MSA 4-2]
MTQSAGQGGSGRRAGKAVAIAVAGLLVVGGGIGLAVASPWDGSPSEAGQGPSEPAGPSSTPAAPAPTTAPPARDVTVNAVPADGAAAVNPVTMAEVSARNGRISDVTLQPVTGGAPVGGTLSADGTRWTAGERLAFNTQYAFTYTVSDASGGRTTREQTFSTVEPANEADAALYPLDGTTVGTGQPLEINFSEPVVNKDAVEKAIKVTSTSGQPGAFYWLTDTKVRYRPQEFWAPNSTITVDMKLFGVDFGNAMIGNFDRTFTVKTHDTRLAVVDDKTKTMNVYIGGKLQRTFPVTLGTPEWPSTVGYHVVMEKYESTKFTAESIGLKPGDEAYYPPTVVKHASRLSNGGAFVHEALPAAQVALGQVNVSHGCVGMSPEGAKYFYDNFGPGDVVQILNTNYGPMYVHDGFGDWNLSWEDYVNGTRQ